MELVVEMIQRNKRKKPCNCACYVRMRETVPFCDNPKSPYYLRCPAGTCDQQDDRDREKLLEQRAREQRETEQA